MHLWRSSPAIPYHSWHTRVYYRRGGGGGGGGTFENWGTWGCYMHIMSLRLEKSVIDKRVLFPLEFNNLSFWITSNKYGHNTHRPIKFTSGGSGHTQIDAVVLHALFSLLHYLYAKDLRHWLFSSRDIDEQRTMWFYWTRAHFGL